MSTNSQQHHMLINKGIKDTKPRRQFIIDFIKQFKEMCQKEDEYTIITIYANEPWILNEKGGLSDMVNECNLIKLVKWKEMTTSPS
jgi:hypothetical protein